MCHASFFTSSAFPKAELFFACMVVIILSILYISIPLIIHSDQEYIKTQQVLTEMTSLHALVKTANKISRERAPSNKLMLSQPDELENNRRELQACRQVVDAQIDETILTLQNNGFDVIALQLGTDLKPKLAKASAQH